MDLDSSTHSIECENCHRPLEVPKSILRGLGPECFLGHSHKSITAIINSISNEDVSTLPDDKIKSMTNEISFLKENATGTNKSYYEPLAKAEKELLSYQETKDQKKLSNGISEIKNCFQLLNDWKEKEDAKPKCPFCKRPFVNLDNHHCKKADELINKFISRSNEAYTVDDFKHLKDDISNSALTDYVKKNLKLEVDEKIRELITKINNRQTISDEPSLSDNTITNMDFVSAELNIVNDLFENFNEKLNNIGSLDDSNELWSEISNSLLSKESKDAFLEEIEKINRSLSGNYQSSDIQYYNDKSRELFDLNSKIAKLESELHVKKIEDSMYPTDEFWLSDDIEEADLNKIRPYIEDLKEYDYDIADFVIIGQKIKRGHISNVEEMLGIPEERRLENLNKLHTKYYWLSHDRKYIEIKNMLDKNDKFKRLD